MFRIFILLLLFLCARPLAAQHGALDPTFGDNGLAFSPYVPGFYGGFDLALQPDGKILVAGVSTDSQSRLTIFRYLPDGKPDPAFGKSGVSGLSIPHYSSWGNRLVLQPDGKIVVAGLLMLENPGQEDLVLARFLPNGKPDVAFGNDGIAGFDVWGHREWPMEVALGPDGSLWVAGYAYDDAFRDRTFLARFRANGTLDPTFGNGGILFPEVIKNLDASINVAYFQETGILIGLGFYFEPQDYLLIRLKPDGTPDPDFGVDGVAVCDFGNTERIGFIAVQPDGKILVAGDSEGTGLPNVGVVRFLPDGTLDTGFGDNGQVLGGFENIRCDPGILALQADGKILLGLDVGVGSGDDFGLVRLLPNGTPDPTFGDGGKVRTTVTADSYDYAYTIAVQPDHKILLAGYSSIGSIYSLAMARYLSNYDPQVDPNAPELPVRLYPNPTAREVVLEFQLNAETTVALDLYDPLGRFIRHIWSPEVWQVGLYQEPVVLDATIPAGAWFLAFYRDGERVCLPVVKQ